VGQPNAQPLSRSNNPAHDPKPSTRHTRPPLDCNNDTLCSYQSEQSRLSLLAVYCLQWHVKYEDAH